MEKPPVLSDELDKVIEGWEYVARHEKGTISKAMMEQILKTIQLLYGYKQARQDTAREIISQIKEFLNKPQYYHFRCWGSGVVLIRDEWGDEPTHQCHSYDGDFNCGCRRCPWENGIIEGTPELQDFERHQNSIIGEIVLSLKSKFLIPPNPVGSADV